VNEYETQQQKEQCEGCTFCDEAAIGKGPCCTYPGKLRISPDGECLTGIPDDPESRD